MNFKIYYFTGTGNSLFVAREIAKKIKSELISISSVINRQSIKIEADGIGLYFPVILLNSTAYR